MSRKYSLPVLLIVMLLTVLVTFQVTYLAVNNKYARQLGEISLNESYLDKLRSIDSMFSTYYLGEIDKDAVSDEVMRGYVAGSGDKYARFFSKDELSDFLADVEGAETVGIGVKASFSEEYGALVVSRVLPGSPAEQVGIVKGDLISNIEGTDVGTIGADEAFDRLQGEAGTAVSLTVIRDFRDELTLSVVRSTMQNTTVFYRMVVTPGTSPLPVGVIQIDEFYDSTPEEVKNAVAALKEQGAVRFLFDVRNNPGGELNSVVGTLDALLPEGTVVRTKDKNGKEEVKTSDAAALLSDVHQTVVLINENTVSAAELFAAAIHDYGGKLVGVTTRGKGTVQSLFRLPDGTGVTISSSLFSPPVSDNFEGVGVFPDVVSEQQTAKDLFLMSDEEDSQLQSALTLIPTL